MSNFLTPIKVLLDMGIRTKSTYRAALEGLDISMDQILTSLAYDPYGQDKNPVQLYRNPSDFRLDAAQKRLAAFATNKEVGLVDYVKHAHNVIYDFLQVIKLGDLHSLQMNSSGLFEIIISNTLHESGIDHNTSTKTKFESQLNYLASLGLETVKEKGLNSYHFPDTDGNRSIIKKILSDRGAMLIRVNAWRDSIDRVSFTLDPINLRNFIETPTDYALPVTDELNDDEMIKLKKLINEIPQSLAFIKASPDMVQTCGFVAESSFSEIEEIVGFGGTIFKRVHKRHAKERAANMNIREIEKEIGENFPVEIARNVMNKLAATMAYFCIENLHATAHNLMIDECGTVKVEVRINQRGEDLRYAYYFDDKYNKPSIPDKDLIDSAYFDAVVNRNDGLRLIDNENNRNIISQFVKSVCDFDVDGISAVRDNCYITRTKYGQEETNLESVFVIDTISVSTDNIDGILRQHELCRMAKKG